MGPAHSGMIAIARTIDDGVEHPSAKRLERVARQVQGAACRPSQALDQVAERVEPLPFRLDMALEVRSRLLARELLVCPFGAARWFAQRLRNPGGPDLEERREPAISGRVARNQRLERLEHQPNRRRHDLAGTDDRGLMERRAAGVGVERAAGVRESGAIALGQVPGRLVDQPQAIVAQPVEWRRDGRNRPGRRIGSRGPTSEQSSEEPTRWRRDICLGAQRCKQPRAQRAQAVGRGIQRAR